MSTMVSAPAWVVVVTCLALCGTVAVGARLVLRRVLGPEATAIAEVVGPLMPALGAIFALLSALALSNEAAQLRTVDQEVAAEAAGGSRLAWASTTPGLDAAPVQEALLGYLGDTRAKEWDGSDGAGDPGTMDALAELERIVRSEAHGDEIGSAQAGQLLGSLDTVTSTRRQRLATRSHQLPDLYLVVVLASGLALVVNGAALSVDRGPRVALLTGGLVVVVALALALLLTITAPFLGGFAADSGPIDALIVDLEREVFVP